MEGERERDREHKHPQRVSSPSVTVPIIILLTILRDNFVLKTAIMTPIRLYLHKRHLKEGSSDLRSYMRQACGNLYNGRMDVWTNSSDYIYKPFLTQ